MMTTAMAGIDLPRYVTTEIRIDNRKRRPTQEEDMDDNGVLVCSYRYLVPVVVLRIVDTRFSTYRRLL